MNWEWDINKHTHTCESVFQCLKMYFSLKHTNNWMLLHLCIIRETSKCYYPSLQSEPMGLMHPMCNEWIRPLWRHSSFKAWYYTCTRSWKDRANLVNYDNDMNFLVDDN